MRFLRRLFSTTEPVAIRHWVIGSFEHNDFPTQAAIDAFRAELKAAIDAAKPGNVVNVVTGPQVKSYLS
jgi:hypothetical protein